MPTVVTDLANTHSVVEVWGSVELVRVVRVTGLTASPDGQLLEALRDAGVPQMGAAWPGEPWFVTRREAEPDGKNAARVILTYGRTSGATFEQPEPPGNDGGDVKQFSADVVELTTTRDRSNNPLTLTAPTGWTGLPNYLSTAKVFRPAGDLQFERLETTPPASRMRALVGSLNSGALGSYGAETLLFVRLDAQSEDGGRTWRCTYQFRYQADGWQHRDRWHAPDGKVPSAATEQTFDVLPVANFSVLGLDFSDSQTPL